MKRNEQTGNIEWDYFVKDNIRHSEEHVNAAIREIQLYLIEFDRKDREAFDKLQKMLANDVTHTQETVTPDLVITKVEDKKENVA